jgi:hypothetical protein
MKFISRTTIATIFTDEIERAVPKKIELLWDRQNRIRKHLAQRKPACERNGDAGCRHRDGGPAHTPYQLEVGLHTGQKQKHENAELRYRIDHALLLGVPREDRVLQVRPKRA